MKTIILALSIIMGLTLNTGSGNLYDYDKSWLQVEKYIEEGRPKSALTLVKEIQTQAENEKNIDQFIKAIVYWTRLTIQTDEKGIENSIENMENILKSSTAPVKQIVSSYLAELYQQYFNNYRYEISQRSEVSGEKGADFRTWTTLQFISTIEAYYLASLSDKDALNIPTSQFNVSLIKHDSAAVVFRPTLYGLLADQAFSFFNNYTQYSVENSSSFEVDESWYFGPAKEFTSGKILNNDESSPKYKILKLYQDILDMQRKNGHQEALADYDLKRFGYVFSQSTLEEKNELYIQALENLSSTHSSQPYYTEIIAVLAGQIFRIETDTMSKVKALDLCEAAIKKYPTSTGAAKCQQIINDIKKPFLQVYSEQVYPSSLTMLFALDYNNLTNVIIETVKLDKEWEEISKQYNQDQKIQYLLKSKKVNVIEKVLPVSKLYKNKKLEFCHPKLPFGQYALLVRNNNKEGQISQFLTFHVSDLSYSTFVANSSRQFLVTDRLSGQPLKGALLTLYHQNYNSRSRRNDFIKSGTYITDDHGKAIISDLLEKNVKVIISKGKDVLDLNQFHYNYANYQPESHSFAEVFTDRAIYRPGQVVYFKAILLNNDRKNVPTILTDLPFEVVFRDANYQEISKLNLTSNQFGSSNGSFTIPLGRLNGSFTITIGSSPNKIYGQKQILVEEYKRPTFEVKTDDITSEYKLGDAVSVTGSAMTLAGTPVDGAQIKYKVVRTARFPGWGWWWRMPYTSNDFIVSQGESITDGEGKFNIPFDAIPDLKVNKKDLPVFTYKIEIDVTDQRGETRSVVENISVGYTSFSLSTNLGSQLDKSDMDSMQIVATSTNGVALEAKGNVKVFQLKEPDQVTIAKYWDGRVDHPIERSHREKIFPYYEYNLTSGISVWEIDKKMIDQAFQTKNAIDIIGKIGAGAYKIEMEAKDKYGRDVSAVHYFVLTDFEKSKFPKSEFLFTKINKTSLQPGETLELTAGVADKPIWIQVLFEKNGELLYSKTSKTDKLSKVAFPIIEEYRGGLTLKVGYVIQNRFFQNSYNVSVPWTNKELNITYETFRDKTLPGSKEEYRIKIKGNKADKVAAEMVAAMYDASLDQFAQHQWRTSFYPASYGQLRIEAPGFNMVQGQYYQYVGGNNIDVKPWIYPSLIPLIQYNAMYQTRSRSRSGEMLSEDMMVMKSAAPEGESSMDGVEPPPATAEAVASSAENAPKPAEPLIRKNLNETVFFFPSLKTDANGDIILSFTINEALTKWKLMSFAHTTDFMTGYDERTVQTQKNLMIFPNAPRFMRDGDKLSFSAKVSNLTTATLTGTAKLQLFDAITMKDVTAEVLKSPTAQSFTAVASGSQGLSWDITMPDTKFSALTYRVTAEAGGHSDGEENTVPVVTNQILVTEAMPMWIKGNETKTFTFNAFKNNKSLTKKDVRYTVEYTSNPVWYAIQALPYMNSPNNVSTLALMDMMYANVLATKIANSHPKIKAVFDQWVKKDKDALLSNLSKNEELKNAVLEETPWVRQSLSEAEQKRNIALLFDLNQLADQKVVFLAKLRERQMPNGGFPWIAGGRDDCYSTQNILESIGHLSHLGALDTKDSDWQNIISNGLKYMDERLIDRYNKLLDNINRYGGNLDDNHLDALSIHYLYIRTFYKDFKPASATDVARNYYFGQAKKYWLKQGLYTQAMIGLIMQRNGDPTTQSIIKSLQERSFSNDELGIYWNEGNGFYWYQLPIERQAMMIEFFGEAQSDADQVSKMKIWLLKNKQTNHWNTSKSSAAAIYALLLQSEKNGISTWVTESAAPTITIGRDQWIMDPKSVEAGTGYAKKSFDSGAISTDLATIKITNPNTSVAWGAAYYQYFERLDQVKKFSDNPLNIDKKLFKVSRSVKGDILDQVDNKMTLKPGDKLKIRITIRVDREMEYVHMKDMRPSGIEPISVISEHKYQGQLSYYESTRDLATHFYFGYLPKGTFVFEYPVTVVHKGDFSGGVTTIECMYAPEFNSHSQGQRVIVK